jgi:RHS repeat-associated protein
MRVSRPLLALIALVSIVLVVAIFAFSRRALAARSPEDNEAPVANNDTFITHGGGYIGPLLSNDVDPEGDHMNAVVVTFPTHGELSGVDGNIFFYRLNDINFTGTDTFTYAACDFPNHCSSPATVTLNLVNHAPQPQPDEYTVRGGTIIGPFFLNDKDPDDLSWNDPMVVVGAHHGTVYGLPVPPYASDIKEYIPDDNTYTGTDYFVYRICDPLGSCADTIVTLWVTGDGEDNGKVSCNLGRGEPVNVSNGNMYLQQTDYAVPGLGYSLDLTRTYNSASPRSGMFGRGWSTAYDESIVAYDSHLVRFNQADGRAIYFGSAVGSTDALAPLTGDFHGELAQNAGAFRLTLKDGSSRQFDSAGKLLSLTDRNNNTSTLSYDSNGFLASVADPFGRVLSFTNDATGRVLNIADTLGTVATYGYDSAGQLLSVTYADNSAFQFSYNGSHRLLTVTDALGNILEAHTYDSFGRAITSEKHGGVERYDFNYVSNTETEVTDALGHVTKYTFDTSKGRNVVTKVEGLCGCGSGSQSQSWTYDNQLNVISHTNALGQMATYTYDAVGNELSATGVLGSSSFTYNQFGEVLTATDALGGVTTYSYDAAGNLLSITDALNHPTTLTYNPRGQLLTMTNARGKVTTLGYDAGGNISEVTDALGNVTSFAHDARGRLTTATDPRNQSANYGYDALGRLNQITRADNSVISCTYDLTGRRTTITDALGNVTSFAYDPAYRLISETDALSNSVTYSYDLMSNLIAATDQLGHTTNVSYDQFYRPTTITYPPAIAGATRLQETAEYNVVGNITRRTDTAGRVTQLEYDNANRVIKVTDPASQVTQYEYDARSNVTAVVDALNQRYVFDYDALNQLIAVNRNGLQLTYRYDKVGNPTRRTDYNNQRTRYAYDALNRLKKITYPDATLATYTYNKRSQLTSATNINGTVDFAYDKVGRLTNTTDVWGQEITYKYDDNDRRTQMHLGSTKIATYTYDALNRLTKIAEGANKNTSYTYDASGKVLTRTLPNGVVAAYSYDGLDRLTRLKDAKGANVIGDNNYSYNNAGEIIQNLDQGGSHAYSYDLLDRLIGANHPATGNESYTYDAVGNRNSSHRSATYSYQPFNRLVANTAANYLHDNNGNMTAKTESTGTTQFAWDFENRLTQVVTPTLGSVSYKYDALGRRIQRAPSNGPATNFSYDNDDVVRDTNSDGTTIDYLNGPGVDSKIWQKSGTTQYYFSQDHLGSTTALTNTNGALVERETYDAYGNTAGSSRTRYGFTGRERDPLTGLMHYRARSYDPQLGRFMSEDPIGLAGGINQFAYVGNDPQNRKDPSGLHEIDVHYYLTYYLALHAGCSDAEARAIANGDQNTDDNPATTPNPGWGPKWYDPTGYLIWTEPDYRQLQVNADNHALHPGSHQPYLDRLWAGASEHGGDLTKFGTYLHYFQDIFSHAGFENPMYGHGFALHYPDKTDSDVDKAMRMAQGTFLKIREFGNQIKCCQQEQSGPDWALVREFLQASGGPFYREISPAEAESKRLLLGVGPR